MTTADLFNKALAAIGHDRFISTENSPFAEGVHCRREWVGARQAVLSAHEWGWLVMEVPLCSGTECTNDETGKTLYVYPRPPSAIRITAILDEDGRQARFEAANGSIQTAAPLAIIRYLPDSDDPADWPSSIQDAVIAELAARLALPMRKRVSIINSTRTQAGAALSNAIALDASESRFGGTSPNKYAEARQ
jgi:hypothetical protein